MTEREQKSQWTLMKIWQKTAQPWPGMFVSIAAAGNCLGLVALSDSGYHNIGTRPDPPCRLIAILGWSATRPGQQTGSIGVLG